MTLHLDTIEYIMDINIEEITTGIKSMYNMDCSNEKDTVFSGNVKDVTCTT